MCHYQKIILCFANPTLREAALHLATAFQLSMTETTPLNSPFLYLTPERLELRTNAQPSAPAIYTDFVAGALGYRRYHDSGRRQPLGRAMGLKANESPHVLDATAGLGRDAFVLACLGCQVHLLERSPVIAALLYNGLQRAYQSSKIATRLKARLQFTYADTRHWLQHCPNHEYPDVIYLDPMYPPRRKSALVKKEMQLLQKIVGQDPDTSDLLETALTYARQRVVVKRPRGASPINQIAPSFCIESKNTRFDVYLTFNF